MQCARIKAPFQPLEVTSLPVPDCPDEGLLLRTLYCGMCHSDLRLVDDELDLGHGKVTKLRDTLGDQYCGLIPGHEICGEVVEVGQEVSSHCHYKPGDVVITYPWRGCQNCEACSEGESQLCENNPGASLDLGMGVYAGGYGSYVAVTQWHLAVRLPKNIDPVIGCMLPCSAVTAYNAILKSRSALELAVRIRGFANLLIVGAGGLGLWTLVLVKSVFCDQNVRVICADIKEEKLKIASRLGVDDAILWKKESSEEELINLTTMSGYNKLDTVMDFVGSSRSLAASVGSLHHGGMVITVGLAGGELCVPIPTLVSKSLSLHGLRKASIHTLRDLVELLAVQNPDTYPPTEVITLQEVNDVLERMRAGTLKGRSIIKHIHKDAAV